jgi:ParB family chromosome partitioning protein
MTITEERPDVATPSPPGKAEFLYIDDPRELLVDRNIRLDTKADEAFLESVRQRGILVPAVAVRTSDGKIRIRHGHRRTFAAIETGWSLPVLVVGHEDDKDVERILDQYAENTQRSGLSDVDQVSAFSQLAAFGLEVGDIIAKTGADQKLVDQALRIDKSVLAKKALVKYEFLDLNHASALAEFQDVPEAAKLLVASVKENKFEHVLASLREERDYEEAARPMRQKLIDSGVQMIEGDPGYGTPIVRLDRIGTGKGDGKSMTVAAHAKCPGHAAYVGQTRERIKVTAETPIRDNEWNEYWDEESETYRRERPDSIERVLPVVRYVCLDSKAHGHVGVYETAAGAKQKAAELANREKPPTPEELKKVEAEAAKAKAERKAVIENNKAWPTALGVRRKYLAELAKRKTPPKGAIQFIVGAIARGDRRNDESVYHEMAAVLLGAPAGKAPKSSYDPKQLRSDVILGKVKTDTDALQMALVMILAGYESELDAKDSWRSKQRDEGTRAYLEFLASTGYGLSDVEQILAPKPKAAAKRAPAKEAAAAAKPEAEAPAA